VTAGFGCVTAAVLQRRAVCIATNRESDMSYAETTAAPSVGDRVQHLSGKVGTVVFVQRDGPASMAREHIRVRWDDDAAGAAPSIASEYTLLAAER
jgi:hypothetical protein